MKMIRDWMALVHARGVAMPAKLALAALIARHRVPMGSTGGDPDERLIQTVVWHVFLSKAKFDAN
jgi:hypothetical protein